MAVDEFVRGVGDGVADVTAGAASCRHSVLYIVDISLKGAKQVNLLL